MMIRFISEYKYRFVGITVAGGLAAIVEAGLNLPDFSVIALFIALLAIAAYATGPF